MVEILGQSLPLVLLTLGVILAVAEAVAPGAHLIVLGVALIIAGLIGLALGSVLSGVVLTVVLALTVLLTGSIALLAYRELDLYGGKGIARTSDSDSLTGRTGRVTERVTQTGGQIKLDGGGFNPHYAARTMSGEIAEGEEVIVIDPGGGNVVTVESLGAGEDEIDRQLALGRAQREREEAKREEAREYEEAERTDGT